MITPSEAGIVSRAVAKPRPVSRRDGMCKAVTIAWPSHGPASEDALKRRGQSAGRRAAQRHVDIGCALVDEETDIDRGLTRAPIPATPPQVLVYGCADENRPSGRGGRMP